MFHFLLKIDLLVHSISKAAILRNFGFRKAHTIFASVVTFG